MRPLTRVAVVGLSATALAGAVAIRPPAAPSLPTLATEAAAQSIAVSDALTGQSLDALRASRYVALLAHRAYQESVALAAARVHAAQARAAQARAAHARVAQIRSVSTQVQLRVVAPAETYLQRGNRILRSLRYDVSALGYRVEFLPGQQGLLGMTTGGINLIQIYVRTSESDLVLAHSIAHEIGHALDFSRGSDAKRASYLSIRGIRTSTPWFGCNNCTDYATPAGDWAEVFAYWLAGPGDFRSQMGPAPSAAQLRSLNALFAP